RDAERDREDEIEKRCRDESLLRTERARLDDLRGVQELRDADRRRERGVLHQRDPDVAEWWDHRAERLRQLDVAEHLRVGESERSGRLDLAAIHAEQTSAHD